jgi:hypothetical protein
MLAAIWVPIVAYRRPEASDCRVAVISGGGSGHEPAHAGFRVPITSLEKTGNATKCSFLPPDYIFEVQNGWPLLIVEISVTFKVLKLCIGLVVHAQGSCTRSARARPRHVTHESSYTPSTTITCSHVSRNLQL